MREKSVRPDYRRTAAASDRIRAKLKRHRDAPGSDDKFLPSSASTYCVKPASTTALEATAETPPQIVTSPRLDYEGIVTATAALDKQIEQYRQMTGEERLSIALGLHEMSCDIARESIRREKPEASPAEVERLLRRRLELARTVRGSLQRH